MTRIDQLPADASERLYFSVFYDGPWSKVRSWAWRTKNCCGNCGSADQCDAWIRNATWRTKLGDLADRLDTRWVKRHYRHPEKVARWKVKID